MPWAEWQSSLGTFKSGTSICPQVLNDASSSKYPRRGGWVVLVTFLHTADWQLGMTRAFLSEEAQGRFTQARIDAIRTMAELALAGGASFGVVAGDVFESNLLSPQVIARSLEAMRASRITWYLLPGNHDPLDASSIYRQKDFIEHKPENVNVIADSVPIAVDDGTDLVGAPWPNKRPLRDLVEAAVKEVTPTRERIRVVIGHGAVDVLAPDKKNPSNISLADSERALEEGRLQYLALGDRHSSTDVGGGGRIRYSGAPEPTDYDEDRPGFALLVELTASNCEVRELPVAKWHFARETFDLSGDADLPRLRAWFDALPSKENSIVKMGLKGTLSLQGHAELSRLLEEARHLLGALEIWERESQLVVRPTAADLDSLGLSGYAREVLDGLREQVDTSSAEETRSRTAGDAMALLYRLARARPTDQA
ncbi:MAG: metallophosphoesterase [Thermoplasmata archaeon]